MRFAILAFLLAGCGSSSNTDQRAPESQEPQIALPEVAGNGYGAVPTDSAAVSITKSEIAVNGTHIVAIADGKPDPSEIDGGALGVKIVKLTNYTTNFLKQRRTEHPGVDPVFSLSMDPTLSYRLLISTMYSIKSADTKRFAVIARSSGRLVALPITLPDKKSRPDRGYVTALVDQDKVVGRRPGADLAKQIEDVKNSGKTVYVKPPFKTFGTQKVEPASTLTGEIVTAKIASAYMAGIRRCAVKKPGHHTFELTFGIDARGQAGSVKVSGETGDVADCLGGLVGGWRFPVAKDPKGAAIAVTATIGIELDAEAPSKVSSDEADARAAANQIATIGSDDGKAGLMQPVPDPDDMPIGLFVSITKSEIVVWSTSGLEGTLREPRAKLPLGPKTYAELSKVLAEIVQRRWGRPDHPRAADTKSIVLMAEGATTIQIVAEVMGAMRNGPDGRELFPDIQLSSGFE